MRTAPHLIIKGGNQGGISFESRVEIVHLMERAKRSESNTLRITSYCDTNEHAVVWLGTTRLARAPSRHAAGRGSCHWTNVGEANASGISAMPRGSELLRRYRTRRRHDPNQFRICC